MAIAGVHELPGIIDLWLKLIPRPPGIVHDQDVEHCSCSPSSIDWNSGAVLKM